MATSRYQITEGNNGKTMVATLLDKNSEPVDLSVSVSVTLAAGRDGALIVADEPATPDPDQTTNPGVVRFTFTSDHTMTVGDFPAQFTVTWGDGTILSFPTRPLLVISVIAAVGVPELVSLGFSSL